jgi:transcriptional pleiotropic regulator of transition state genes
MSNIVEGGIKMKSTGIVRRVDELGRVVIPIELRRTLEIAEKDALEIYVDGEQIILKKYQPACIFCGDASDVVNFKGKNICKACLKDLKNA